MGVQGRSPGKLERSRSDEEMSEAYFPKVHSLPLAGGRTRTERPGVGAGAGLGLGCVWGQGYCANNSR